MKGRLTFIFPHLNICRVHEKEPPYALLLRSDFCTPECQTHVFFFFFFYPFEFEDLSFGFLLFEMV